MKHLSLLAIWVATMVLAFTGDGLGATNSTMTVGVIDLQNTPVFAVAEYFCNLTGKTVVISPRCGGGVHYRAPRDLTIDEAYRELSAVLKSNDVQVLNFGTYIKLMPLSEATNETSHVEIEIDDGDTITIDGKPVPLGEIANTLKPMVTPETEAWIYDARRQQNQGEIMTELYMQLAWAHEDRSFRAYVPKKN